MKIYGKFLFLCGVVFISGSWMIQSSAYSADNSGPAPRRDATWAGATATFIGPAPITTSADSNKSWIQAARDWFRGNDRGRQNFPILPSTPPAGNRLFQQGVEEAPLTDKDKSGK